MLSLLPLHDFSAFLALLSFILLLAVIVCAIHLLFSQYCLDKKLYFPAFLGAIHCIYLRRPARSSLSFIVFCWLLWHFYYFFFSSFPLPTVFGYMAPFSIYIVCPIPPLPLSISITLKSLSSPCSLWLFCAFSLKFWLPTLHTICSSLFLYNPPLKPSLGCIFFYRYAVFLSNILCSVLLCLWFLSNLINLFYYSSIIQEGLSVFANFLLISPLNFLLNFSIRDCLLYPFPFAIFLNSWIYLSHVFSLYSIVLNCFTFLFFSTVFLNLFLILLNNSSAIFISDSPFDNLSNRLSFQASATPLYT